MSEIKNIISTLLSAAIAVSASYYVLNLFLEKDHNEKKKQLKKHLDNFDINRRKRIEALTLNQYEIEVLQCLVNPSTISSSFADIGGLDDIIQDIEDTIFLPLENSTYIDTSQFTLPKGILLYGPPGTGKTMLAKAIAKQSGYYFLNINDSLIESKYYGETGKIISAIFSVAEKIQPVIVFFDEIDAIVGQRNLVTNDYNISKKSVLLQLWDGLKDSKIVVIGATNRIDAIDDAFMRRLPKKIRIDLPNIENREKILRIMLKDKHVPNFDFKTLSKRTNGKSGSDLRDLVNEATNNALKRVLKSKQNNPVLVSMDDINHVIQTHIRNNSPNNNIFSHVEND